MRRNMKVIEIRGCTGLLSFLFIGTCLAAGFIAFPALVIMNVWNYAANYVPIPLINVVQGLMLWAIVAIAAKLINDKKRFIAASQVKESLSEREIKSILENVKLYSKNNSAGPVSFNPKEDVKNFSEKEKEEKENV